MKKIAMILSMMFLMILVVPVVSQAIDKDVGYNVDQIPITIDQASVDQQIYVLIRGGVEIRAVDLAPEIVSIPVASVEMIAIKTRNHYTCNKPPGVSDIGLFSNEINFDYFQWCDRHTLNVRHQVHKDNTLGSGTGNGGIGL